MALPVLITAKIWIVQSLVLLCVLKDVGAHHLLSKQVDPTTPAWTYPPALVYDMFKGLEIKIQKALAKSKGPQNSFVVVKLLGARSALSSSSKHVYLVI